MNKRTILIGVILIFIIAGLYLIKSENDKGSENGNHIKFGFVGPLTGDGAVWGIPQKNGITLAAEEINKAGGINGKRIEVLYEDGKCTGKDGVNAGRKLLEVEKVKFLLVSCSQEVLPLAPITEQAKVIMFASYAMNSLIADAGEYIFRNAYKNADVSRTTAETVIKEYKRVGVITELTEFAAQLRDEFRTIFVSMGGEVIEENFPPASKDVRSQVTNILRKNPEAIYVNPTSPLTGMPALKQLKEQGSKGQIYGNFFGSSSEIQKSPEAEGMIFFADPDPAESEISKKFFQNYQKHFDGPPDLNYPAAAGYDSMYILKQAIEAVGEDTTKVRDYLYSMKLFSGALGTYRFDKKGDVVGLEPSIKQIKGGSVIPYNP